MGMCFTTALAQQDQQTACDNTSIIFAEFSPLDETIAIRCLSESGRVTTLLQDAGLGTRSPDSHYIAYTITNNLGPSMFDYDMTLYIYEISTGLTTILRDGDGHISANWVAPDQLVISVWNERITTYAAFRPDHRFLYDAQTTEMTELDLPIGGGSRVIGYWSEENSLLFANYSDGLLRVADDGLLIPIPLPIRAYDSDFAVSDDGNRVAYRTTCEAEDIWGNCLAILELGTDEVSTISTFAENGDFVTRFSFSPTGRYIAVALNQFSMLAVYDLALEEIIFRYEIDYRDAYEWANATDDLYLALIDENDPSQKFSDLYRVNLDSGELEQMIPEPIRFQGFF